MDGRKLIMKASVELNNSNLLLNDVSVIGIESATGDNLNMIVNKFLDDVETIPEAREHLLPDVVMNVYNGIVDDSLEFGPPVNKLRLELESINFTRTLFPN